MADILRLPTYPPKPGQTAALSKLRALRRRLPDLAPDERAHDAACRRFRLAASLCVEERFAEAVGVMDGPVVPPPPAQPAGEVVRLV